MTITKPTWALTHSPSETSTFAGGTPYLGAHETWPRDEEGRPWRFLLQVDLSQVPPLDFPLPREGFLQFFHAHEDLLGMSFQDPSDPSKGNRALVRHVVEVEDRGDLASRVFTKLEHNTPLEEVLDRRFYKGKLVAMEPFLNSVEGEEFLEGEEEEVREEYEFHLGGFPLFTQEDFRTSSPKRPTLLLGSESGDSVCWGDAGAAGYWLDPQALAKGDFSQAFIYWDCY